MCENFLYPTQGFPIGSDGKESTCNSGNLSSIPGLGKAPGGGNGYPLQYSGLENPMDRDAWRAAVHGVTKSQTRLSDFHFHRFLRFYSFFKILSVLQIQYFLLICPQVYWRFTLLSVIVLNSTSEFFQMLHFSSLRVLFGSFKNRFWKKIKIDSVSLLRFPLFIHFSFSTLSPLQSPSCSASFIVLKAGKDGRGFNWHFCSCVLYNHSFGAKHSRKTIETLPQRVLLLHMWFPTTTCLVLLILTFSSNWFLFSLYSAGIHHL